MNRSEDRSETSPKSNGSDFRAIADKAALVANLPAATLGVITAVNKSRAFLDWCELQQSQTGRVWHDFIYVVFPVILAVSFAIYYIISFAIIAIILLVKKWLFKIARSHPDRP